MSVVPGVKTYTAPYIAVDSGWVRFEGELSHDAKTVAAAFHGPPEVRIGCAVGIRNGPITEDYFKVEHIVTGKALKQCEPPD